MKWDIDDTYEPKGEWREDSVETSNSPPAFVGSLSVVPHLIAETLSHPSFPVKKIDLRNCLAFIPEECETLQGNA